MLPDNALQQEHDIGNFTGLYVGLDLSLACTGVAMLNDEYLTTWNLVPGDKLRGVERLGWYWHEVNELLKDPISTVCVENYAFNKGNQAHQVGELGGLVRLILWRQCVSSYLVAPATLKKFVTGSGGGKKAGIPLHLYKRWGLTVEQEDQADATGLALMAMLSRVHTVERIKAQTEALEAMSVLRPDPRPIRPRQRVNPGAQNS